MFALASISILILCFLPSALFHFYYCRFPLPVPNYSFLSFLAFPLSVDSMFFSSSMKLFNNLTNTSVRFSTVRFIRVVLIGRQIFSDIFSLRQVEIKFSYLQLCQILLSFFFRFICDFYYLVSVSSRIVSICVRVILEFSN